MGGIMSLVSNIMYLSEKITLYLTCVGLICCLVLTITMTLGMGVGLGYNYCFVDMKTKFKYVKGHYIYPGSPRWPYKREGNALEEPVIDETAEEDALRAPHKFDKENDIPNDMDLRPFRDHIPFNNSGDEPAMGYHPTFSDVESDNKTESSIEEEEDASTNDTVTEITENNLETNGTSNTTASTTEENTKIMVETEELAPGTSIVNKDEPKSSTSSMRVKKLVIPISGLDLISLLSKLKAENRNYSLQIVTN